MSEYIECEWEPVLDCDDDGTHNLWARRVLTDGPKHRNLRFWYIERGKYIEHVGEFYIYDYENFQNFSSYPRFPIKICESLAEAKYWADEKIEEYLLDGYFEQFQEELEEDEEEKEVVEF